MPDALLNLSGAVAVQLVAAPSSPQFIRVLEYHASATAATQFQLYSGPNLIDIINFNGTTPVPLTVGGEFDDGVVDCGIGQPLYASSTIAAVGGTLKYAIKGAGG